MAHAQSDFAKKKSSFAESRRHMDILLQDLLEHSFYIVMRQNQNLSLRDETYRFSIFTRLVTERPEDCKKILLSKKGAEGSTNLSIAFQFRELPLAAFQAMIDTASVAYIQKQYISNVTNLSRGCALIEAVKRVPRNLEIIKLLIQKGGKEMIFFQDHDGRNSLDHIVYIAQRTNSGLNDALIYLVFKAIEAGLPWRGIEEPFEVLPAFIIAPKVRGLEHLLELYPDILSRNDPETNLPLDLSILRAHPDSDTDPAKKRSSSVESQHKDLLLQDILQNGLLDAISNSNIIGLTEVGYRMTIFNRIVTESTFDCKKILHSKIRTGGKTNLCVAFQVAEIPHTAFLAMIQNAGTVYIQKQYISNRTFMCRGCALIDAVKHVPQDRQILMSLILSGGKEMVLCQDQNGRNALDHLVHLSQENHLQLHDGLIYIIFKAVASGLPWSGIDEPLESTYSVTCPPKVTGLCYLLHLYPDLVCHDDPDTNMNLALTAASSNHPDLSSIWHLNKSIERVE